MRLTPHFHLKEFACSCCGKIPVDNKFQELAEELEKVRKVINKPIKIISGYRCPTNNSIVGGAANSYHLTGRAADISSGDMTGMELYKAVFISGARFTGVGIKEFAIHLDIGERLIPAFWTYPGVLTNKWDSTIL